MFKFFKNAREFVVCFHSEGRWQWDTQSHITKLEDRISAVLNANNRKAFRDSENMKKLCRYNFKYRTLTNHSH